MSKGQRASRLVARRKNHLDENGEANHCRGVVSEEGRVDDGVVIVYAVICGRKGDRHS